MARSTFVSFHYERDHARVQQVLQMGAIVGQKIVSGQDWEAVKRQGKAAVEKWIDDQMKGKSAVVVLVGAQTASRQWVDYEIRKAWNDRRPLVGIRIHRLKNLDKKTDTKGPNPFAGVKLTDGTTLDSRVTLHDPTGADSKAVYANIQNNLDTWVANAKKRP